MTTADTRAAIGGLTVARGLLFAEPGSSERSTTVELGGDAPAVDTAVARQIVHDFSLASFAPLSGDESGIDPAPESLLAYLRCPAQYLAIARGGIALSSLDSVCKLR